MHRYYGAKHLHFVIFNCHHRQPLLARRQAREVFILMKVAARILLGALLLACAAAEAQMSQNACSALGARPPAAAVENCLRQLLHEAGASGFLHVRDVRSDRVLAHVTAGGGSDDASLSLDAPVAPLSVIKVYVAAMWLEHGFGDRRVTCGTASGGREMLVEEALSSGCDSAGKQMAVILRRSIGGEQVLRDLRRFGLAHLTLRADMDDDEWGRELSLGEAPVLVTPRELSNFFSSLAAGGDKLMSRRTAQRLVSALDAAVQNGTASSIKDELANTGWRIGGKTGTGPGKCGDHCDGWFASIATSGSGNGYVILAFIRGRGPGGGLPAHLAARIAYILVRQSG